jgi:hypothetical protein
MKPMIRKALCLIALLAAATVQDTKAETVTHIGCDWCTSVAHLDAAISSYLSGTHAYGGQVLTYGPNTPPGTRIFLTSSVVRISGEYLFHGMTTECFEFLGCIQYPVYTSLTTTDESAVQLDRQLLGRMKDIPPYEIPANTPGAPNRVQDIPENEAFQNFVGSVFPILPGSISWWGFDGWLPSIGWNVTVIDSRTGEEFKVWAGDVMKFFFSDGSSIEVRMEIEGIMGSTTQWRIVQGSQRRADGCMLNSASCNGGQAQHTNFSGGFTFVGDWSGLPGGVISIQSLLGEALCMASLQICIQHQAGISCHRYSSRC